MSDKPIITEKYAQFRKPLKEFMDLLDSLPIKMQINVLNEIIGELQQELIEREDVLFDEIANNDFEHENREDENESFINDN